MITILLVLFLFQAGAPAGAVTGIVRSASGTPAADVRVYAQQVRDPADPNALTAPLEGLAQTDASGRYRIELAGGRYYIASGSVSAPTYYPGTTSLAAAKEVVVTSGGVVEGIDFGSFVAAVRFPLSNVILVAPAGTLAGTVRFPDGSPAANTRVVAFPQSVSLPPLPVAPGTVVPRPVQTDAAGQYQINNVPPGWHYLVAGFAEASGFHTVGADATQPKAILLTSATRVDSLDITVPLPPPRTGTTVSGKVLTRDGVPAAGAIVQIVSPRPTGPVTVNVLPSINAVPHTTVASDGTFTFSNVVPGFYNAQVSFSNVSKFETVDVGNSPVTGLQFSLPAAIFSGRILLEDGQPLPDPELFVDGVLTIATSNMTVSTRLPIAADGTFAGLPDIGESRFYFRSMPEEYEIRSIAAGSLDLMKETVRFDGTKSFFVEARVARKSAAPSSPRVVGTALDSSGRPTAAARVQLCCLSPNSIEALSAPLGPDGSFAFANVPPGTYTTELRAGTGQPAIKVMRARIGVEAADRIKIELISGPGTTLTTESITIPRP
jgi:hypothetical protein